MGIFFTVGEKKVRPGVYQRYENRGTGSIAGAVNGIVAAVYKSNWGPLGAVETIGADEAGSLTARLGGGTGATTQVITEAFNGGATTVLAVRLGSGGTNGTLPLKDTTDSTPADAITLTTKYPGSRSFKVTIREKLGDSTTREFLVTEGDMVREKLEFPVSAAGEVDALIAAINEDSSYFTAEKASSYAGTGKLALVAEQAITAGTDPTTNTESYSDAFNLLEPYRFNVLVTDSEEVAVHALLAAYIERVYQGGKIECFGIVAEPVSVDLEDRMDHAKAFNDYNIIYIGGGWTDAQGIRYEGRLAGARMAGMIAAVASNTSLTHTAISGATEVLEMLTDSQYKASIQSGMLTFSTSAEGTVWIESAITTLVTPSGEDDEGWKKIKRAKIRKELMARVSDSVEPLIGKINNDSDGQANIITVAKGVCAAMRNEKKILEGYSVELDESNPPEGDSAWFLIQADDIDSIEKSYFVYGFRYSATAA